MQTLYVVAAAGLAALVPLILFAGFWVRAELGKSQRDVDVVLVSRATALSQRIDAEVEQQIAALRALSALPSFDDNAEIFEDAARRLIGVMPHWSTLSLVATGSGASLFRVGTEPSVPPDPALIARASTTRRPLVHAARVSPDRRGGVVLYMPVLRQGEVRYVLFMDFDAGDIQDIVAGQKWETNLASIVVDAEGRVLARSSTTDPALGQDASPEIRTILERGTSGRFQFASAAGEPLRGAYATSPLTGWSTLAQITQKESDRLSTRSIWATIAAGILSLALAGILAVFIINTVMERRVSDERLAASRALGELDARLLSTTQEALGEQRKASSEREILLREIYHRVKNNLQIVQSLLRLGSRDLKPEQREPFENAVRRIGAMARVHTLLYNSPDLASIDFKDYLDELLKELSEGFAAQERSIESVLQAGSMRMPLDTAVPLAFIAVEILTNSFKHAFPEGRSGRITVEIERSQDDALLKIHDDGIGVSYEDGGKRRLGLTIVRKLVQQIGGTLEEPLSGSSVFVVRFPLAAHEVDAAGTRAPIPAGP